MKEVPLVLNLKSNSEILQEFSEKSKTSDLNNIKLPFTLKNKILMSPGTWNGMTYTSDVIREAYNNTDFSDKTVNGLYHDHLDGIGADGEPNDLKVTDWVGDVTNVHMEGDVVRGDLNVLDWQTAVKLAYGAKFGISPSVKGLADEDTNTMLKFRFNNHGIVVNPAIKTAFINNSEKDNQKEKLIEELKEEFKIKLSKKEKGDTMAEPEVPKKEAPKVEEKPKKEEPKKPTEEQPKKEEMSMDVIKQEMADIKTQISELSKALSVLKENKEETVENSDEEKPAEEPKEEVAEEPKSEEPAVEEKKEEMKDDLTETVKEMSVKIQKLEKEASEPVRLTQEMGGQTTTESTGNHDQDMLNYIKGLSNQ